MNSFLNILGTSAVSVVLIGFLVFLFRNAIEKIISRSIDHTYDIKLSAHKSQLNQELELLKGRIQLEREIASIQFSRYSQEQFSLYNELWASLCDLRSSVERLWNEASVSNANKLAEQLGATKAKVEKSALLMEPHHYVEINMILDEFTNFQFGKVRLVELRRKHIEGNKVNQQMINDTISSNQSTKEKLEYYLDSYMNCLRSQLRVDNSNT